MLIENGKPALALVHVLYNWNDALGDTVMEKFESLYICIHEASKRIDRRFGDLVPDPFGPAVRSRMVKLEAGEELMAIFETPQGFFRETNFQNLADCPDGLIGSLNKRWVLFLNRRLSNKIILSSKTGRAEITVLNFLL